MENPSDLESQCPYAVNNTIKLHMRDEAVPSQRQSVEAKITNVIEPFTLSSVMVISLDSPSPGLQGHLILKLYDRRFAAQLRKEELTPPWTSSIEREYRAFVANGGASAFIADLRSREEMVKEEGKTWDAAQNETYLHNYQQELYKAETEVYRRVEDLQGRDVPRLVAHVTVPDNCPSPGGYAEYVDCPGIILEYIQGFLLSDLAAHAPCETWQSICEDAIRIVHTISDRGIRNEDVKTRNFVVRKDPVKGRYKVFMIDFALCKFRGCDQDERDWREWKATQDEEGAVGYVMQKYLKGGYVYSRSAEYLRLDNEFKSEED